MLYINIYFEITYTFYKLVVVALSQIQALGPRFESDLRHGTVTINNINLLQWDR